MNHGDHAKKDDHYTVIMAWSWPCFRHDHGMVTMFFLPGKLGNQRRFRFRKLIGELKLLVPVGGINRKDQKLNFSWMLNERFYLNQNCLFKFSYIFFAVDTLVQPACIFFKILDVTQDISVSFQKKAV